MDKKIIMFSGKFCAPCKIAYPVIKDFCEKHSIELSYHLVEECEDSLLEEYNIEAVPTFFLTNKHGNPLKIKGWTHKTLQEVEKYFDPAFSAF